MECVYLIQMFIIKLILSKGFAPTRTGIRRFHTFKSIKQTNTFDCGERDLQQVIEVAENAAKTAGEVMLKTSGKIDVSKTKMNTQDLVTQSDIKCQRLIKDTILSEFPTDIFLGEEDVEAGSKASVFALNSALCSDLGQDQLLWIVDPIDGTTNFQSGLPLFCVSIGVVSLQNGSPTVVAGVIYNPVLNEMISAVKGRGCTVNGMLFKPRSSAMDLNEALINVGYPVSSESTLQVSSKAVSALSTRVRGIRMIACASQVMSWVAQGKLSAYVSWDLNAWDVAAGMLIVEESGGFISDFEGVAAGITSRDLIVSTSQALSQDILKILEEKECLKY